MNSAGNQHLARVGAIARAAFTLVELLVVTSIIALLVSVLLPVISATRQSVQTIQCASNIRQLCTALLCYAAENRGRFPPNTGPMPGVFWCDKEQIGRYLSGGTVSLGYTIGGPVMTCPADPGAVRSYAMNIWASSDIPGWMHAMKLIPAMGILWSAKSRYSSQLILITEAWSNYGSQEMGWLASEWVGLGGMPGERFGAGLGVRGIGPPGRFHPIISELPYLRHRRGWAKSPTEPKGRVNIGYADGHVATKAEWELADWKTGKSTYDTLWSPIDRLIEGETPVD